MKKVLGLDLGTTSIGWAYVLESADKSKSEIVQIGSRIKSITPDEQKEFEKGDPISTNAKRTLKRGARRNVDRYQDRRNNLVKVLIKHKIIEEDTVLTESGKETTHKTLMHRAKAAEEKVELAVFARILLAINKKRGYKSSRKTKNEEDGQEVDGMDIAKRLIEEKLTPGQFAYQLLKKGKKKLPDFYRSDLQNELDTVWNYQKQFHSDILTDAFYKEIQDKGQKATSASFYKAYNFNTAENKGKRDEKKLQAYKWRSEATQKQLAKEEVAYVITEINNDLNKSSGYLGAISDRSKELFFNQITVGQYLYNQIEKNTNTSLKNQVFYRQDYENEFEQIWETQAKFYPQLTNELKEEIRDRIIFYQRPLKSQKGLLSFCEFEQKEIKVKKNGKTVNKIVGLRVAPKSSPLFQEFKIWQILNEIRIRDKKTKEVFSLAEDAKEFLFEQLNLKGNLKASKALGLLGYKAKDYEINYKDLEGNRTSEALYNSFLRILELEELNENLPELVSSEDINVNSLKTKAYEIKEAVKEGFSKLGINTEILNFNSGIEGNEFEKQAAYQLWHLLYSIDIDLNKYSEEDVFIYGNSNIGLKKKLCEKFGFKPEHAKILVNTPLQDDHGSLSAKAMRKILSHLKDGYAYGGSKEGERTESACELAGYRHSKSSLTSEENEDRVLKDKLELLPKNSLRQPIVERVLNQMINLINMLIDKENDKLESQGKARDFRFDEIRIELARDLKKNAKERKEMSLGINAGKKLNDKVRELLRKEFGILNPTRNDVIRYRLYEELKTEGYKDIYSGKFISKAQIFNGDTDIDHIIPQSKSFDDSFSNKVLSFRQDNLDKSNRTGYDYIAAKGEKHLNLYIERVEGLYNKGKGAISKAKYQKLLKRESEIEGGFIERDLRETQYIARKAREILMGITRSVVSTSGNVTNRLREDWGLINIMKELSLPKYRTLGMTEFEERRKGNKVEVIKDWSKRNDHRHHAMDALTVAFTKHNHIQYLNYLNARKDENHENHFLIKNIEDKETILIDSDNGGRKRVFAEPILNFRQQAKKHLENVLISHKAQNKVVTRNINKTRKHSKIELTPRGQLHKETVYGKYHYYENKMVKVNGKMDKEMIEKVDNPLLKKALMDRLNENKGDAKKAFTGKNALSKTPIFLDEEKTIELPELIATTSLIEGYSVRKEISHDNFKNEKSLNKVIDEGVKRILKERVKKFNGDYKAAFSNLELDPIWMNKEKGISIKRTKITGVTNVEALHHKKDHFGKPILKDEAEQPVDFVSTGNNHHVAVYRDEKGKLQENVVSFYEAVARVNQKLPVIDKNFNQRIGWQFLYTMKQNEMFVFPNEKMNFNPKEVDLLDPKNRKKISPNLFRVQYLSEKDYFFRHHLETTVEKDSNLRDITWIRIRNSKGLDKLVKVRINHLGDIVQVGEY